MAATIIEKSIAKPLGSYSLWHGDVESFLSALPGEVQFDFIVTSPPYNIGKEYEERLPLPQYLRWQYRIIREVVKRLKEGGSLCWQVGSYVDDGSIMPLDLLFAPIFRRFKELRLRNRIIWHYGHGLHAKRRFSGRYETVLWYTKGNDYVFDLDAVRVPSKYPSKRAYKGSRAGTLSGNPLGKNPTDFWIASHSSVWDHIPNVKSNHIEKTEHPCQFPVALVERLLRALTNEGDLVFDPFAGVGTAGVAAALLKRRFIGCEPVTQYVKTAQLRIDAAISGTVPYRSHDIPLYDHTRSRLSEIPEEWS